MSIWIHADDRVVSVACGMPSSSTRATPTTWAGNVGSIAIDRPEAPPIDECM